jgi:hypothetical protein
MMNRSKDIPCTWKFLIHCWQKAVPCALFLSLMHFGIFAGIAVAQDRDDDFLFSEPKGFLGFRIGKFFPRADSDLFDEITDTYTLEKNDFRAWDFGFDGGVNLHERVDLVISLDFTNRTKASEYRDWVDSDDLPIVQKTNYAQAPLTAGLKFLLVPRGRKVGQYAWLPNRIVPYIGAGAGIQWYRFKQSGDFIDFSSEDLDIYPDEVRSSGWTPVGYVGGGFDINIYKQTYVTLDLKYSWAKPELDLSFVGYDPLDLSGIRASAGFQWHF